MRIALPNEESSPIITPLSVESGLLVLRCELMSGAGSVCEAAFWSSAWWVASGLRPGRDASVGVEDRGVDVEDRMCVASVVRIPRREASIVRVSNSSCTRDEGRGQDGSL